MQIKRNSYNLGISNNIEISSNSLDIKANIIIYSNERELKINSYVSGRVVDIENNPIENAIVKLINSSLQPITSTITDKNGNYVIDVIPSNINYIILVSAKEKSINQSPSFALKVGENKLFNFTLYNDPNVLFGAISGTLTDKNNNFLKGVIISLYKKNNGLKELFAITYSDFQGTFFFGELLKGEYVILIQTLNNISYEETIILENKKIYNFNKSLNFSPNINDGSISGTITDNLGNPISNADVILYKIENNIKIPIAFTQTTTLGLYSFINVPFGFYLVKSNATASLATNMVSPSVKITATSELDTYNLSSIGILENGAKIDSTGFVSFLGGEEDGTIIFNAHVNKYGLYTLAIYYLAADFNRPLKININGKELEEVYKVSITPSWEITDSKVMEISTSLNEGLNIVKFHGDGKNLAPNISMVTLIFNETENNTMFTTTLSVYNDIIFENISMAGLYSNGAKYDKETFLATSLGGKNDGAVTVSVDVTDLILYYMQLKYISKSSNFTFKIDLNGVSDNNIYKPPQTNETTPLETSTFTLPIAFNKTFNFLKFHGDGKNLSPDLDSFYLTIPPITQNLTEGIFENNAKPYVDKQFVLGIGGPQNGAVSVSVDVSIYGYYKIYLEYVATLTTLPLKIDINGLNNCTITNFVPPTGKIAIYDKKIFSTILYLNSGINTLRFYGNGKDLAPNLSSFKLIKTNIVNSTEEINSIKDIYEVMEAKLSGSATLDQNKTFIIYLGGKNNGAATFNITVQYDGEYVLQISYYYGNRNFNIDVNNVQDSIIYKTPGEIKGIFKTNIKLKAGNNTLKFYGYVTLLGPNLGNLMINLNSPLNLRKSEFFTYNNAIILPSGVIKSIGGKNEGRILINYFAYEYAEFTLNFIISNTATELLIQVNASSIISIKNIPKTKSTTVAYNKNIVLNYGDNFIEFLGNGENIAPDIYSLDIKPAFSRPFIYTYNLEENSFKNNVTLDIISGFVKNIGGKNNGTALLIVQMETDGFYDLNIQYINPYNIDTPLRLKVNNKSIENTYYIPNNENMYHSNKIKIFVIPKIQLKSSINFIEFSGNGIDPVADIGKIRLSKASDSISTPVDEYYAIEGKLENGAKIATFSKNFVDKLGGNKQDGSVTIKVNSDSDNFYELFIQYLITTDNNNLIIDINGNYTGTMYKFPKTDSLKEENSKNFIIPIFLYKGINNIKFHGDKINVAPSIGKINITKTPQFTTYTFLNAKLKNAELKNSPFGFIILNGSFNSSSALVTVIAANTDYYYLIFKYISKKDNYVNISVNSNSIGTTYNLQATKSENISDAKTFTIKVNLKKGENTVLFTKPKKSNDSPLLLNSFSISTNMLIKNITLEKLFYFNSALFNDSDGFIHGLGGEEKGYVIMNINVPQGGLYNLYVNYLSLDTNRKLKLEINDNPLRTSYIFSSTGKIKHKSFVNTFTIAINLKIGENKIKLYGSYNLEAPIINEMTLSVNTENNIKVYYLSDGILKGKASLDKSSKTVSNIGGKDKGEVTININVSLSDFYNLQLQYKSDNSDSILFLEINNMSINKTFKLIKTKGAFSQFNTNIFLNAGDNVLRFYGDITNNNLILGNFILNNYMNLLSSEKNNFNFNIALGELKNGATVYVNPVDDNPWVKNIGGKNNGSSTLTLNLDFDGEYSLLITSYIDFNNSKKPNSLTISVNSIFNGNIYSFSNKGFATFEIIVKLKKGKNKIKFAGDGKNDSPNLSSLILNVKNIDI